MGTTTSTFPSTTGGLLPPPVAEGGSRNVTINAAQPKGVPAIGTIITLVPANSTATSLAISPATGGLPTSITLLPLAPTALTSPPPLGTTTTTGAQTTSTSTGVQGTTPTTGGLSTSTSTGVQGTTPTTGGLSTSTTGGQQGTSSSASTTGSKGGSATSTTRGQGISTSTTTGATGPSTTPTPPKEEARIAADKADPDGSLMTSPATQVTSYVKHANQRCGGSSPSILQALQPQDSDGSASSVVLDIYASQNSTTERLTDHLNRCATVCSQATKEKCLGFVVEPSGVTGDTNRCSFRSGSEEDADGGLAKLVASCEDESGILTFIRMSALMVASP
ncbi:unnamed protein product [Amoebophrya sp. A25]|nr:unnamed protein product [Amoebophrya sp. A25]|eukprot:GSA25T00015561001.1